MSATRASAIQSRRPPSRRGGAPRLQFLRGFLKHPVMVGSIIPSSRTLIERALAPVNWANTKLFVEYGPGVGTFTKPILEKLGADATLLALDTNADFTDYLRDAINDPRLMAVTGSAAEVGRIIAERGLPPADFILSGLPFSTLPDGVGPQIAAETHGALRPGGAFIIYQFSPKVREFIAPHFAKIDRGFEWRNVPPATLFWAWKD